MKGLLLTAALVATTSAMAIKPTPPAGATDFNCQKPSGVYSVTATEATYDNGNNDGWVLDNVKFENGIHTFEFPFLFWTMEFSIPEDGSGATYAVGSDVVQMNCTKL